MGEKHKCAYCGQLFKDENIVIRGELYHPHCLRRQDQEAEWLIQNLKYDCPKCLGSDMICTICSGKGRVRHKPKEQIGVIGWEIGGIFFPKD